MSQVSTPELGIRYDLDFKKIVEGERNATLASLAGSMRRKGIDPAAIDAALQQENLAKCHPPLSADEVQAIARSMGNYAPTPQLVDADRFHKTDLGNADRFAYLHGDDVRHVSEWGAGAVVSMG